MNTFFPNVKSVLIKINGFKCYLTLMKVVLIVMRYLSLHVRPELRLTNNNLIVDTNASCEVSTKSLNCTIRFVQMPPKEKMLNSAVLSGDKSVILHRSTIFHLRNCAKGKDRKRSKMGFLLPFILASAILVILASIKEIRKYLRAWWKLRKLPRIKGNK